MVHFVRACHVYVHTYYDPIELGAHPAQRSGNAIFVNRAVPTLFLDLVVPAHPSYLTQLVKSYRVSLYVYEYIDLHVTDAEIFAVFLQVVFLIKVLM